MMDQYIDCANLRKEEFLGAWLAFYSYPVDLYLYYYLEETSLLTGDKSSWPAQYRDMVTCVVSKVTLFR